MNSASTLPAPAAVSPRRGARLLAYSHVTVDFYQGTIAALIPFLVLERGYTYAAAAGIVLASSLSSSVVQPVFGALGDKWRMEWLIPVSIFFAGAGIAGIALSDAFWVTAVVASVSGIGVAAYHPAAASRARDLSGNDHVMMSWFSLGGNIGFAVAPLVVAATVGILGLKASPLLMIPALTGICAVVLIRRVHGVGPKAGESTRTVGRQDDWSSFARASVAIICRSIVFVGIGSFIVLFMHQYRGVGENLASASLFVFYIGGAFGTAIGGYLARRWPRTTVLRWAYLLAVPVVAGMLLVPGPVAWVFIALASIVLYVPFSLHVTLGQDYLPQHMGTASGVTLEHALLPLILLPAVAWLVLLGVKEPYQPKREE